jgi:GTP-binding protein
MTRPVVAIIGRQNVGKSTLLNRLTGKQIAIIEDLPGTTRDRVLSTITWENREFSLVDTGGLEYQPDSTIKQGINEQIKTAIDEADVLIFLVDVRDGVTPLDMEIAAMLRRTSNPVVLAINKVDNTKLEAEAVEFYELGMGEPIAVSAHHGRGTAELLDTIIGLLPNRLLLSRTGIDEDSPRRQPNVGKSALLNALLVNRGLLSMTHRHDT